MGERNWITDEVENWIINDEGMNRHAESICEDYLRSEKAAEVLAHNFEALADQIKADNYKDAAGEEVDWEDICRVVRSEDDDNEYAKDEHPRLVDYYDFLMENQHLLKNVPSDFIDFLEMIGEI